MHLRLLVLLFPRGNKKQFCAHGRCLLTASWLLPSVHPSLDFAGAFICHNRCGGLLDCIRKSMVLNYASFIRHRAPAFSFLVSSSHHPPKQCERRVMAAFIKSYMFLQ